MGGSSPSSSASCSPASSGSSGGTLVLPLLATRILWINLLTDSATALCVDTGTNAVMSRPPRSPDERVIVGRMWPACSAWAW